MTTVPTAQRTANTVLRQARLNLGMSQSEFAKAVQAAGMAAGEPNGANKRLVQKWESGEHVTCRPNYARALQAVTGLSAGKLGMAWGGPEPSGADPEDLPWRLAWPGVATGRDSALRLRVALEPPRRARTEDISSLRQLSDQLFTLERVTPARELLPKVERQLLDTSAVLAGTSAEQARRVLTLTGAQTAVVAGRLALDCGDTGAAGRYLEAAMTAAHALEDGPLWAFASTYAAAVQVHGHGGRYGWHLVHDAVQRAGALLQVRAWVVVRAAQESARCGESAAALANLETVSTLDREMQDTPQDGDAPPWARDVDRAVLAAMTAQAYAALGDEQAAFEHGERAAGLVTGEPVKWRALVLAEAACAAARLGKSAQADRWATEARELAARLQCTAAQHKLRTLRVRPEQTKTEERAERPTARAGIVGRQSRQRAFARSDRS